MIAVLHLLGVILFFIASIVCAVTTSRCPFTLVNRTSTGSCHCNRILREIICSDLDAVPDFSTSADDEYCSLHLQRGTIHRLGPSAFAGLPRLVKFVVDFNPLNVGGVDQAAFQWDWEHVDERIPVGLGARRRALSSGTGSTSTSACRCFVSCRSAQVVSSRCRPDCWPDSVS